MTKALLDNHPDLFVIPPAEFDFFCYSHHKTLVQPKYSKIIEPNELLKKLASQDFIVRMSSELSASHVAMMGRERADVRASFAVDKFLEDVESITADSYHDIFPCLFRLMGKHCGLNERQISEKIYVFKNTLETEFFGLYKKWFPKIKLLYVIRNPYAQFAAQTRGEYIQGSRWSYPLLAPYVNIMKYDYYFINYWKEVYPDDIRVVRYEDLVESTESVMKEVAEFIGVEFNSSMLAPTILGEPWGGNSSAKGEVYNGVDSKPLHRWRSVLSAQEIYIVTKYFSEVIREYGYDEYDGRRSIFPIHRSENFRRYIGNKYLEYAPYY